MILAVLFGWFIDPNIPYVQMQAEIRSMSDAGYDLLIPYLDDPHTATAPLDPTNTRTWRNDGKAIEQMNKILESIPNASNLKVLIQMPDGHWQDGTPADVTVLDPRLNPDGTWDRIACTQDYWADDGVWKIERTPPHSRSDAAKVSPFLTARLNRWMSSRKIFGTYSEEPNLRSPIPKCPLLGPGKPASSPRFSPGAINEVYRRVKTTTPRKSFFLEIIDDPPLKYTDYSHYAPMCDILATAMYPLEKGPGQPEWTGIGIVREAVLRIKKTGKPFYFLVQAQHRDPAYLRAPTYDETKWMTYIPLVNGGSGVLYWSYFHADSTEKANANRVVTEAKNRKLHRILNASKKDTLVSVGEAVDWTYRLYKGNYYLIAVHRLPRPGGSPIPVTYSCYVGTRTVNQVREIFTDTVILGRQHENIFQFTDTLPNGGVKLYRLIR